LQVIKSKNEITEQKKEKKRKNSENYVLINKKNELLNYLLLLLLLLYYYYYYYYKLPLHKLQTQRKKTSDVSIIIITIIIYPLHNLRTEKNKITENQKRGNSENYCPIYLKLNFPKLGKMYF
jgi:hypothetical protein